MQSPKALRLLWIAFFAEVGFAFLCLVFSGWIGALMVLIILLGLLGGLGFIVRSSGIWSPGSRRPQVPNWPGQGPGPQPGPGPGPVGWPGSNPNLAPRNRQGIGWNMNTIGSVSFNLGSNPERTEQVNLTVPLDEKTSSFVLNLTSGGVKMRGQEGLKEVRIVATKRVWANDEMEARNLLDRLRLTHTLENGVLRVEAGDPDQGLVIGRAPRMDLDIELPPALAADLTSNYGEILTTNYNGDLSARTNLGAIAVESYNSGRNISLNTTSGKLSLQGVAAGQVKARSGAGMIELSGVGAEDLDLDSTAASIRARSINCGRYAANAVTGSLELYDATVEGDLEMKAGAGRIHGDRVTAGSLHLEATTGSVFYRGGVPKAPSEVVSRVGSVNLVFAPGTGFNLEASSNLGTVDTVLPVTGLKYQNRNIFEGQVAGGGAPVRANSQVGSIKVTLG